MYGDKGPPKGYSAPRYDTKATKFCQYCSSTAHWSYECSNKKSSNSATPSLPSSPPKLSRTQLLKYGIKRKRTWLDPKPTEKEQYNSEIRELEKVLVAEAKSEAHAVRQAAAQEAARAAAASAVLNSSTNPDMCTIKQEADPTGLEIPVQHPPSNHHRHRRH